jgi:hypothetical protein
MRRWKALLSVLLVFAAGLATGLVIGLSVGACPSLFAGLFPPRYSFSTPQVHRVLIRVENRSPVDFRKVLINGEPFGDIRAGASSPRHVMQGMYRYAAVTLETPSGPMAATPVDFVGERQLPEGIYTYVLTIKHGQLQMECVLNM